MEQAFLIVTDIPWKLFFRLRITQRMPQSLQAEIILEPPYEDIKLNDLRRLFTSADRYDLQIETDQPDVPIAVSRVDITDWQTTADRILIVIEPRAGVRRWEFAGETSPESLDSPSPDS